MKSNIETAEVAQPYAQALMSIAKSQNLTEQFGEDARALVNLLTNSAPLQNLIDNPFIQPERKKAVITQILGDGANPSLRKFLLLLVDKRRIFFLEAILQ